MLCHRCGKNHVVIFIEQNINGNLIRRALCRECAEKEGICGNFDYTGLGVGGQFFPLAASQLERVESDEKCPVCRTARRMLEKGEKPGCPQCYDTFRQQIKNIVRSVHGNVVYKGKLPRGARFVTQREGVQEAGNDSGSESRVITGDKQADAEMIKRALLEAVKKEDYERAAILRDQLRLMEEKKGADAE